jgi:hypothetical protein
MWVVVLVASATLLSSYNVAGLVSSEQSIGFDSQENCTAWVELNVPMLEISGLTVKGEPCVLVEVDADGNVVE